MRKLASIRKISKIFPIKDADFIEVATVDGWEVVVKKGEFKEGDLAIYFEIDSFIPHNLAPFLTKEGHEPKEFNGILGQRLRTVKLRKQISQGLLMSIDILPKNIDIVEGSDVTEILEIQKWEPPYQKFEGNVIGNFPDFIPKTECERVQNIPNIIELLKEHEWEITEKIHGQSITVFLDIDKDVPKIRVCSRNVEVGEYIKKRIKKNHNFLSRLLDKFLSLFIDTRKYQILKDSLWESAERCRIIEVLLSHYAEQVSNIKIQNIAIQGELYGSGIQSQTYGISNPTIAVFQIYDITNQRYFTSKERLAFCKKYGLVNAPILDIDISKIETLKDLLKLAEGKSVVDISKKGSEREGLVFKSLTDPSVCIKVISNSWLINEK